MTAIFIVTALLVATLSGLCVHLLIRDRERENQLSQANHAMSSLAAHFNTQFQFLQYQADKSAKELSDRLITLETQNRPVIEREIDKPSRGRGWIAQREQIQQAEMSLVSE